jgi:protocatechuate 3,4-dioxygenase beta subunit
VTLTLTVVSTSGGCSPVAGANVEIWQCDATGNYSQYGTQTAQTYLRGIQTTDANGQVTFTTIFPGGTRDVRRTSTSKSSAMVRR